MIAVPSGYIVWRSALNTLELIETTPRTLDGDRPVARLREDASKRAFERVRLGHTQAKGGGEGPVGAAAWQE